ncbi:hypothetical protein BDV09DRAFT_162177 [Aspergillus tetrazonus]
MGSALPTSSSPYPAELEVDLPAQTVSSQNKYPAISVRVFLTVAARTIKSLSIRSMSSMLGTHRPAVLYSQATANVTRYAHAGLILYPPGLLNTSPVFPSLLTARSKALTSTPTAAGPPTPGTNGCRDGPDQTIAQGVNGGDADLSHAKAAFTCWTWKTNTAMKRIGQGLGGSRGC